MSLINGLYLFQCKYGAGVWGTQGWRRLLIHSLQRGKHIWTVVMGIWWTRCDIVIICWGYHLCRIMFKQLLIHMFCKKGNYRLYLLCYILCRYFFVRVLSWKLCCLSDHQLNWNVNTMARISFHLSNNLK